MRVISGAARGRPLHAAAETRPTTDVVKGAIFSMLEALAYKRGFEPDEDGNLAAALAWPRVLDLFAGSGALGIEALSRGARSADFVESDREAARAIEANLRTFGFEGQARVHQAAAPAALSRIAGPFDAVFIDPPYREAELLEQTWSALLASSMLAPSAVVVLEQPANAEPLSASGDLTLSSSRKHGRTRISLYAVRTAA
jgi:16S rRNA (guanine966-N2)-methyltransferase